MPTKKQADYVRVKEGFSTEFDGANVTLARGEFIRADHALVKRNPDLFEELSSRFDPPEEIETTAEPGRKRGA